MSEARYTITRLTRSTEQSSCMNEIQVRRKFVNRQSTRSGKDKWWFVLHGNEDILISLETGWESVKLQEDGSYIEHCTKPIDTKPSSEPQRTVRDNRESDTDCPDLNTGEPSNVTSSINIDSSSHSHNNF